MSTTERNCSNSERQSFPILIVSKPIVLGLCGKVLVVMGPQGWLLWEAAGSFPSAWWTTHHMSQSEKWNRLGKQIHTGYEWILFKHKTMQTLELAQLKESLGEGRTETSFSGYVVKDVYQGTAPPICLCIIFPIWRMRTGLASISEVSQSLINVHRVLS